MTTTDDLMQWGLASLQSGRLDQAEAAFRRILKSRPKQQDALHFLGMVAYRQRRYEQAVMWIGRSVRAAPGYAEAHNNLGMILLELRKPKEAETSFRRAVALREGYGSALANLGNALRQQGRFREAAGFLVGAIAADPSRPDARYRLMATLLSLGEPADALAAADAWLAVDPLCQHALAYRIAALQQLGRHAEAAVIFAPGRDVATVAVEPPGDSPDLQAFNAALEDAVRTHPSLSWEPSNRVTRGGAVSQDLLDQPGPVISGFERALRQAIDRFRDAMTPIPGHPFYGRRPGAYRLTLIASILRAGGHHPPHIHEGAWLSGCYYVKVPQAVDDAGAQRSGWIEFGRPDCAMAVCAMADCATAGGATAGGATAGGAPETAAFKPVAGAAFFFPSYFFHGTIPFAGSEERIGIAFDAYPER